MAHRNSSEPASWRLDTLAPDSHRVLFGQATEAPFSSPLNGERRPGRYLCAACQQPLFSSEHKYDSGSGWPSFHTVETGAIGLRRDFRMLWPRTEYHCSRCGGHQGHVFRDGPQPTGLRYCNNGLALQFVPDEPPAPEPIGDSSIGPPQP